MRGQFKYIFEEAKTTTLTWNIDMNLLNKKRKIKVFFYEFCLDDQISDPLKRFRLEVFVNYLDILIE